MTKKVTKLFFKCDWMLKSIQNTTKSIKNVKIIVSIVTIEPELPYCTFAVLI